VAEIWKVANKAPALAAAGAVQFLEKVSPALAQVDSSSGAIGTADLRVLDGRNTGHPLVAGPATLAKTATRSAKTSQLGCCPPADATICHRQPVQL
jgi:hypothetical protein